MLSGDSRGRRKTKRIGCSEYCVIDHEGFRSVCMDRWVLQTVASQMDQQYRRNSGTNGPIRTILLPSPYSLACGCVDFIQICSLSYLDTMLHGSLASGKMVLGILERNSSSVIIMCC